MNSPLQNISSNLNSSSQPSKDSSNFNDPAFASNKVLPIHRWVPWIAGFSSEFVRDILSKVVKCEGLVLDPFSGVGTTLVEAVLQGHNVIGFEINPYAALACRMKVEARQISVELLNEEICKFQHFYSRVTSSSYTPKSTPPPGFKTRAAFYSPKVLKKVLIIQDFIASVHEPTLNNLFKLAFASTMIRYSNYSYEPSLSRRVSAGKEEILDFPVDHIILSKLIEMSEDIKWLQNQIPIAQANTQIIAESFFDYEKHLSPNSIDLIITSPPYLNNYHYNRNTRPQLYWLGYAAHPQDMKPLEHANFGKYWQTVREKSYLDLEFSMPDRDIAAKIESIRNINLDRGIYGGNGWANYAASYFNDCYRFAKGINYCLKSGGMAFVVIGNSILQGILIPTDQYFGKIAESVGLELVKIDVPRATRVGNSIIQSDVRVAKAQKYHQLYEAVVVLRKV
jgi:DNA modification methylase